MKERLTLSRAKSKATKCLINLNKYKKGSRAPKVSYVVIGARKRLFYQSIYVKLMPTKEEVMSSETAIEVFEQCCNPSKEFLFRFDYNASSFTVDTTTLHNPNL